MFARNALRWLQTRSRLGFLRPYWLFGQDRRYSPQRRVTTITRDLVSAGRQWSAMYSRPVPVDHVRVILLCRSGAATDGRYRGELTVRTGVAVDATPIYTELQQTLIDPEANNWGPSAPPEFAAALTERTERSKTETKKESRKGSGSRSGKRSGGRRHRAED
jgi:hypothetical protein